jgi:hypothetical protein
MSGIMMPAVQPHQIPALDLKNFKCLIFVAGYAQILNSQKQG